VAATSIRQNLTHSQPQGPTGPFRWPIRNSWDWLLLNQPLAFWVGQPAVSYTYQDLMAS